MPTEVMAQPEQTETPPADPPRRPAATEPSVRSIIEAASTSRAPARGALVCSMATSVALWAAFTPVDAGWLGWLALAPLMLLIRIQQPTRWMYRITYASGLAWSLVTLQWMRLGDPAMYLAWVALAVYVAMYFPVFVAVSRSAVHRFGIPITIAAPVVWTGLEYLRSVLMTGFAWYYIGHTQYAFPEMIQIADLVGVYGISFVLVFSAACLTGLIPTTWLSRLKLLPPVEVPSEFAHLPAEGMTPPDTGVSTFKRPWLHVAACLALVAATLTYGFVRRSQADFKDGPRVALVQGNFETSLKHNTASYENILWMHERLTGAAVRHQPDLIVWPETMFRWPLQTIDQNIEEAKLLAMAPPGTTDQQLRWTDSWRDPSVRTKLHSMSEQARAAMVIGIDTWVAGNDGIKAYNSAAFVTPNEGLVDRYDKMHRVIFGEYIPLQDELPWLHRLTPFSAGYGIAAGTSAQTFRYGEWTFAPVICFEDTVPQLLSGMTRGSQRPIDVFVNLTNDGWFKGSSESDQHLITSVFRTVETRTPMVRAVNTGISAVIDGDGVVREPEIFIDADARSRDEARTSLRNPDTGRWNKSLNAALVTNVPLDNRESLYVRGGDWFAQANCFGLVFFAVAGFFLRRRSQ